MMDDAILDQLVGRVKPPDRGHVVEAQSKVRGKLRRVMLPLWDLDAGWEDSRGGVHYSPHPSSGWYDSERTIAVRTGGYTVVLPGSRKS